MVVVVVVTPSAIGDTLREFLEHRAQGLLGCCDEREPVLERRVDGQRGCGPAVEAERREGVDHAWVRPRIGADRGVGIG